MAVVVLMNSIAYDIRFAQRVSMIKNSASVNEDVDADATIKRLKTEILSLREEVAFLKVSLLGMLYCEVNWVFAILTE